VKCAASRLFVPAPQGWFLDRTLKRFTTGRAAEFLGFLGETTG
jgi:hypothetical protein